MRRCADFFKHYHTLLAWAICASLVLMTYFHIYIPGGFWLIILFIGLFFEGRIALNGKNRYQISTKFKVFVIITMVFSFLFMFLNFFFHLAETGGSQPEIVDGAYAMVNYDGKGIKLITEQEYYHFKCVEQRFFCGHLLGFYALCMTAYLGNKKSEE